MSQLLREGGFIWLNIDLLSSSLRATGRRSALKNCTSLQAGVKPQQQDKVRSALTKLEAVKVHRVLSYLSFHQTSGLMCYIDFKTEKREQSPNDFEKISSNWVNNSVSLEKRWKI